MKVAIDRGRCSGHLRCMDAAPDVFDADDLGFGEVIGDGTVPPHSNEAVELAIDNCPERAIHVVDNT
jgi:ferredoxin